MLPNRVIWKMDMVWCGSILIYNRRRSVQMLQYKDDTLYPICIELLNITPILFWVIKYKFPLCGYSNNRYVFLIVFFLRNVASKLLKVLYLYITEAYLYYLTIASCLLCSLYCSLQLLLFVITNVQSLFSYFLYFVLWWASAVNPKVIVALSGKTTVLEIISALTSCAQDITSIFN